MTARRNAALAAGGIVLATTGIVAPFWGEREQDPKLAKMYPNWPFVSTECPNVTQEVCTAFASSWFSPPKCAAGDAKCCDGINGCLWLGPTEASRADDRFIEWKEGQCQWYEDIGDPPGCFQKSPLLWPCIVASQGYAIALGILFGWALMPDDEEMGRSLLTPLAADEPEAEFRRRVNHGAIDKVAEAKFGGARKFGKLYRLLQVLSLTISFPLGFWYLKPTVAAALGGVTRVLPLVLSSGLKTLWDPTTLVAPLRIRGNLLKDGNFGDKALGLWFALEPAVFMGLAMVLSEGIEGDMSNTKAKETWERLLGERGQRNMLTIILPLMALWPALAFLSFTLYMMMGPSSLAVYCLFVGAIGGAGSLSRGHLGHEVPQGLESFYKDFLHGSAARLGGCSAAFVISAALIGVLLGYLVIPHLPERREELIHLRCDVEDVGARRLMHAKAVAASVAAKRSVQPEEASAQLLEGGAWEAPEFPEGFTADVGLELPLPESCVQRMAPGLSHRWGYSGGLTLPLLLMALNAFTTFHSSMKLIGKGNYWFGGLLAAASYTGFISQYAKGLLGAAPTSLKESAAAGLQTRGYIALIESEGGFEAVPAFMLQLYALPWLGTIVGVLTGLLSILLSVNSITDIVVTLVDFEVDALFEEEQESTEEASTSGAESDSEVRP